MHGQRAPKSKHCVQNSSIENTTYTCCTMCRAVSCVLSSCNIHRTAVNFLRWRWEFVCVNMNYISHDQSICLPGRPAFFPLVVRPVVHSLCPPLCKHCVVCVCLCAAVNDNSFGWNLWNMWKRIASTSHRIFYCAPTFDLCEISSRENFINDLYLVMMVFGY